MAETATTEQARADDQARLREATSATEQPGESSPTKEPQADLRPPILTRTCERESHLYAIPSREQMHRNGLLSWHPVRDRPVVTEQPALPQDGRWPDGVEWRYVSHLPLKPDVEPMQPVSDDIALLMGQQPGRGVCSVSSVMTSVFRSDVSHWALNAVEIKGDQVHITVPGGQYILPAQLPVDVRTGEFITTGTKDGYTASHFLEVAMAAEARSFDAMEGRAGEVDYDDYSSVSRPHPHPVLYWLTGNANTVGPPSLFTADELKGLLADAGTGRPVVATHYGWSEMSVRQKVNAIRYDIPYPALGRNPPALGFPPDVDPSSGHVYVVLGMDDDDNVLLWNQNFAADWMSKSRPHPRPMPVKAFQQVMNEISYVSFPTDPPALGNRERGTTFPAEAWRHREQISSSG